MECWICLWLLYGTYIKILASRLPAPAMIFKEAPIEWLVKSTEKIPCAGACFKSPPNNLSRCSQIIICLLSVILKLKMTVLDKYSIHFFILIILKHLIRLASSMAYQEKKIWRIRLFPNDMAAYLSSGVALWSALLIIIIQVSWQ